ncbi:MAG: hypothetical protein IPL87_04705 [Candidatus Moraniibacteriota bacterium]|nr:MAG: hypothetical protein IPL87_04705 [Candidatus Moranbacteria bacterium]
MGRVEKLREKEKKKEKRYFRRFAKALPQKSKSFPRTRKQTMLVKLPLSQNDESHSFEKGREVGTFVSRKNA